MFGLLRSNKLDTLTARFEEGKLLDHSLVSGLESGLQLSPNNAEIRAQLLGYYVRLRSSGPVEKRESILQHRTHIKWFVENMPENALAPSCTWGLLPEDDSELFADLELLWQRKVAEDPACFDVVFNMSSFCECAGLLEKALDLGLAAGKLKGKDSVLDKRN